MCINFIAHNTMVITWALNAELFVKEQVDKFIAGLSVKLLLNVYSQQFAHWQRNDQMDAA